MARYLGVDGGGTKTAFVLIDQHGTVLAESVGPSLFAFPADPALIRRVLTEGLAVAGIDPAGVDRAFFALPGHGESAADLPVLERVPGEVLGHDRYAVGNDVVAGRAGSLGGEDGVHVIAGTGSIASGAWRGRTARVGGWSEVFGDEGSGYWTAVRGLNAFSRMSDGRLPRGPLHGRIQEAVGAPTALDVIGIVGGGWDRTRIAALSRVVVDAADAGDAVAAGIVDAAGRELAALAQAVRTALGAEGRVPVSYSGGMFTAPSVLAAFSAALGEGFDLRPPRSGPAIGAALLAADFHISGEWASARAHPRIHGRRRS